MSGSKKCVPGCGCKKHCKDPEVMARTLATRAARGHVLGKDCSHQPACECGRHNRADPGKFFREHNPRHIDSRSSHPHYNRWYNMMKRCFNPSHRAWKYYGGRGITVCDEWQTTPAAFYQHLDEELGPCPSGHTMDRIDNDGDYEPGNLRWATQSEQIRNSRRCLK